VSDNNGNVFVCGDNIPTLSSFENYFIIKYDLFGNQIWFQSIDSTGNDDFAFAIAIDKFGDVYCTGTFHVNQENIATIKFSNSGVRLWIKVYTGIGGDDRGFAVKVDSNLNVYVTGDVNRGGCDVDMITVKYSQVDVFHSIHESNINSNVKIIPNPFNEYSILTFANPQNKKHTLTIFNTTGQIVQQKDNITGDEIIIERENLVNGLYFFQLRSVSNIVASGKLIVD
jgi:hypothetical protein